jgi:hypothetical protein
MKITESWNRMLVMTVNSYERNNVPKAYAGEVHNPSDFEDNILIIWQGIKFQGRQCQV